MVAPAALKMSDEDLYQNDENNTEMTHFDGWQLQLFVRNTQRMHAKLSNLGVRLPGQTCVSVDFPALKTHEAFWISRFDKS